MAIVSDDFNNDGHQDLVVTAFSSNTISILFGIGNGSFQSPLSSVNTNGINPYLLTSADFNRDGQPDLAIANEGSHTVSILLGRSDGTFNPTTIIYPSGGIYPSSIIAVDLNHDNITDLVVTNADSDNFITKFGIGNGSFSPLSLPYVTCSSPTSVAHGDFNGDGNVDLAVVSRFSNRLQIFTGSFGGSFVNTMNYTTGGAPYAVRAADLDSDSRLDLIVNNFNDNTIGIFLGTGVATFYRPTPATYSSNGAGPWGLVIHDFDGDSNLDLIVSNQNGNNFIICLGKGDGTFGPSQTFSPGGIQSRSIIVTDLNEDGNYDIVMAYQTSNNIAILLAEHP
jgi:hypothetical protein